MPSTKPPARKTTAKKPVAHPPGSTMTATLIPAKPWHQRGMVAIVLVVIVAVLAVGFVAMGAAWSNKIEKLNKRVGELEAQLAAEQTKTSALASQNANRDQVVSVKVLRNASNAVEGSVVAVKSSDFENLGFSLIFPWGWGVVRIANDNLSMVDGEKAPFFYESYTFASGFRSSTDVFEIFAARSDDKTNTLIKTNNLTYLTEKGDYAYYYKIDAPSRDKKRVEDEVKQILATIKLQ